MVLRPGGRRQVASVNRRAAGGIGDDGPIAEELGHQLQVGRLAAAGAGAGELEQRLEQLRPLHRIGLHQLPVDLRDLQEELKTRPLARRCSSDLVSMLIALCRATSLLTAGQTSTQTPQPVQSSGATWIVIRCPGRSWPVHGRERKPGGAPARAEGSKTLLRITACGQTNAQRPHSMQMSGSQIGISCAMLRFSSRAVPVGNVPSGGKALTGTRSPLPARITAVTRSMKSDAPACIAGSRFRSPVNTAGIATSCSDSRAPVHRGEVPPQDRLTPLPICLFDRILDFPDRMFAGHDVRKSEEAGLHHRVDSWPQPRLARHAVGIHHKKPQPLFDDLFLDAARQLLPDLVRAVGAIQQEDRARLGVLEHVEPVEEPELMAGHEIRAADQVRRRRSAAS